MTDCGPITSLFQNKVMFLLKFIFCRTSIEQPNFNFRPHGGTPEDGRLIEVQP